MDNDICTCKKTSGEHDGLGLNGACLSFALDRKATYWAEKRAASIARSVKLSEDIKAGRVRPMKTFEQMVTREAAPAPRAGILGQLDKLMAGEEAQP